MILLTRNYLMIPHLNFFGDENIDKILNSGRPIASQFHSKSISQIFHAKKDTFQYDGVYRIKTILKAQRSIQNYIFKSYIFKKSVFLL